MKLKDLYSKPINRAVNPAVSATKFDPETERIEIDEYVFTDEIINGLFRILDAIKNNKPYDHVGIWIDGYYGSGKSHFLKYLDYCITPSTRERAVNRLLAAVKAIDPLDEKHNLNFDYDELLSIANWLKRATIDTCIFNLETSYDNSTDKKKAFLHVFWNEFNGKRGFNKFNITLAQNLEKPLAEKGVFEAFKERIAEEGGDWNDPGMAADLIDNELDWVLDIAKELAPTLSVDSIRERIIKRDTNMSIDRFGMELASYLKDKGDDYRLILLADEVSQFINKERDRYLNLQEIITKLSEACDNKVWVACTAQQDLSEIMDDCHIAEEKDKEGKIKGRFEVKVSLKGTQPEVITQKRILDKKEEVKPELAALYNQYKAGFDLQFKLPTSYSSYETQDDFVDYYPFVPYQFKLIMQVFNSFLNLGYVAKEVKGNERSIIKVIHSTAKTNADAELGKFISFDELYNNMFEEGLQARGQKAVDNALRMARTYQTDRPERTRLAVRVANVLFMICNISQTDQLVFPATLDNVTSLLINDMETPRLNIKNEVEKVIEFLCDNNIIRREQGKQGAPETYAFYSEEEMKVAQLIQSQVVDNNTQAEQLKEIFNRYITALRNVNPGDYDGLNAVLTDAEHEVEIYLNKQFAEVNVSDVLAKFAKAPYGWDNICTLYIINELVRRHNRDYSYANNPNVETSTVANRIVSESNKFTLRQAKVISPQVIQNFTSAWKEIFGISAVPSSTDSTQLFRACRDIESDRSLAKFIKGYKDIEQQIAGYQFCQLIREAIDLFESWLNERDPQKFFNLVIAAKDEAKVLIDKCKEVVQFTHDQLDTYKQLIQFQDDNLYNFPFVPMEMQGAVTDFNKLKNDPWPISGLRGYIKLQRQLSGILNSVRDDLRSQVRDAYTDTFRQLRHICEKNNVDVNILAKEDVTIHLKTSPSNILQLKNNLSTDEFYQEQVVKILAATKDNEDDDDKKVKNITLNTKTSHPLETTADIDDYLSRLRTQLMKAIENGDSVMVIK